MHIKVITFKSFPAYFGASFKGCADVALNEQLMLRGLKLFKTALGYYVQLPELHTTRAGTAYNFLSAGLIKQIQSAVVQKFEEQNARILYEDSHLEYV